MRSTRSKGLALLLITGLLAGCGKSSDVTSPTGGTPGASNDQALVTSVMAAAPQAIDDGLSDASLETTLGGQPGALAAIQPFTYWRTITRSDRTFEFVFSDPDTVGRPTTAMVTIRRRLSGQFNILAGDPPIVGMLPDTMRNVIHKPLLDHWVRRVLLKRMRMMGDNGEPLWRIAAVSGVQVTSRHAATGMDATTHIGSLRVQSVGVDTVLTDPLAFERLRKVLRFQPQSMVTLTVKTDRVDDVVVLHHADRRFRFHNNGDMTYTGVWTTGLFMRGLRHVGVNALSHGTLFDDQAPYDSQSWIFPYSLEPESMMAEYMP
jgi:hypothetical protein